MSEQVTCVREWDRLRGLANNWNVLVESSVTSTVFQTYEWHDAWWGAFSSKYELLVLLLGDPHAPWAIVPWVREGLKIQFLGGANFASDYCDFILSSKRGDQGLRLIVDFLANHSKEWGQLDLFNLPSHSAHREKFESILTERGVSFLSRRLYDAPTRRLGDTVSDQAALNKKSLKRHLNYFKSKGTLEHRLLSQTEGETRLAEFFSQHIARREHASDVSQFIDPQQKLFFERLLKILEPRGWLRFSVVSLDQKPLAFHFGFAFGGRFIWYKPTFDVAHLRKSPGEVLLRFLLQQALDEGLGEFDFTVGNEAFKYRFANEIRSNHRLRVFRVRWSYQLAVFGEWLRNRRNQWLKGWSRIRRAKYSVTKLGTSEIDPPDASGPVPHE